MKEQHDSTAVDDDWLVLMITEEGQFQLAETARTQDEAKKLANILTQHAGRFRYCFAPRRFGLTVSNLNFPIERSRYE